MCNMCAAKLMFVPFDGSIVPSDGAVGTVQSGERVRRVFHDGFCCPNCDHQAELLVSLTDDPVNNPAHYGGKDNPYEVIKIIEAHKLGYHLGNTVKYILRAPHKGNELQDLRKAAWYLARLIEKLAEAK
jgi:hypothetical protein